MSLARGSSHGLQTTNDLKASGTTFERIQNGNRKIVAHKGSGGLSWVFPRQMLGTRCGQHRGNIGTRVGSMLGPRLTFLRMVQCPGECRITNACRAETRMQVLIQTPFAPALTVLRHVRLLSSDAPHARQPLGEFRYRSIGRFAMCYWGGLRLRV